MKLYSLQANNDRIATIHELNNQFILTSKYLLDGRSEPIIEHTSHFTTSEQALLAATTYLSAANNQ